MAKWFEVDNSLGVSVKVCTVHKEIAVVDMSERDFTDWVVSFNFRPSNVQIEWLYAYFHADNRMISWHIKKSWEVINSPN